MRQVIVYKTERDDWVAACPSLPGCTRRAETKTEALDAIKDAIDAYVQELKQNNAPIPDDNVEISVIFV